MNAKRLITIAIAATFLIGGIAAVGAASPADTAAQNATNVSDDPAPDEATADDDTPDEAGADDGENASEERAGNADDRAGDADGVGPSDGLPEQVPDRVSEIHETIDSFLSGPEDRLGSSLSDLLSGDNAADGNADDADGNADDADGNADDADGNADDADETNDADDEEMS
jgi:hypothetical protein